jgi:creatinine amidohydrolase
LHTPNIGILEKHGPGVPIGSDLIRAREWAKRATKDEHAVVFPDYFYGQINEVETLDKVYPTKEKQEYPWKQAAPSDELPGIEK